MGNIDSSKRKQVRKAQARGQSVGKGIRWASWEEQVKESLWTSLAASLRADFFIFLLVARGLVKLALSNSFRKKGKNRF